MFINLYKGRKKVRDVCIPLFYLRDRYIEYETEGELREKIAKMTYSEARMLGIPKATLFDMKRRISEKRNLGQKKKTLMKLKRQN